MKLNLEKVLSLPRSKHTQPKNRGAVGGFLYQKMGRSGVLVTMQDFEHKLPITELSQQMGESVVRK